MIERLSLFIPITDLFAGRDDSRQARPCVSLPEVGIHLCHIKLHRQPVADYRLGMGSTHSCPRSSDEGTGEAPSAPHKRGGASFL